MIFRFSFYCLCDRFILPFISTSFDFVFDLLSSSTNPCLALLAIRDSLSDSTSLSSLPSPFSHSTSLLETLLPSPTQCYFHCRYFVHPCLMLVFKSILLSCLSDSHAPSQTCLAFFLEVLSMNYSLTFFPRSNFHFHMSKLPFQFPKLHTPYSLVFSPMCVLSLNIAFICLVLVQITSLNSQLAVSPFLPL